MTVRLTESGNTRSEQLLVVPTELLTNREWLPGELLSGSERQRPGCFIRYEISDLFQLNFFPYIVHTYKAYASHADVPSDTGDKSLSTLSRHLAIEK